MSSFGTHKTITGIVLFATVLACAGSVSAADEQLRCEARALQIEAKVLRCVGSCRAREERRHWFNEERCLSKCEGDYDESFSELLCAADRRLVRMLDAANAEELYCEARVLQVLSRSLRCSARCEDSIDPDACTAYCDTKYGDAAAADECAE